MIVKEQWSLNTADLNPYSIRGTTIEAFSKLHPKPKTVSELKFALEKNKEQFATCAINKAVLSFIHRLKEYTIHFGYLL